MHDPSRPRSLSRLTTSVLMAAATHSTIASARAGLDQDMPGSPPFYSSALKAATLNGSLPPAFLNDMVKRILGTMFASGMFDRAPRPRTIEKNVTSPAHSALARKIAAESGVLLKNAAGVLPLRKEQRILVVGDAAASRAVVQAGGSGAVAPPYIVTPLDGVRAAAGGHVGHLPTADATEEAVTRARADVVVVCVAVRCFWPDCGEGHDRPNLSLPLEEDALVARVVKAQSTSGSGKVVVAVVSPGAVLLPWSDSVDGILLQFLPGQEAGNALADLLFGRANPSGRLHTTLPNIENETQMTPEQCKSAGNRLDSDGAALT